MQLLTWVRAELWKELGTLAAGGCPYCPKWKACIDLKLMSNTVNKSQHNTAENTPVLETMFHTHYGSACMRQTEYSCGSMDVVKTFIMQTFLPSVLNMVRTCTHYMY